MKKLMLISLFLLFQAGVTLSQDIAGIVTYQELPSEESIQLISGDMSEAAAARVQDMKQELLMNAAKTAELRLKGQGSSYRLGGGSAYYDEEPDAFGIKVMSRGGSQGTVFAKDLQSNSYERDVNLGGERFLVKDDLPELNWELTKEHKEIAGYTCYKATYTEILKRLIPEPNPGGVSELKAVIDTVLVTAWYTPEIAVSNGPDKYGGLPGLILEVTDNDRTITCEQLVLNPTEEVQLDPTLKKGEVISEAQYATKFQEMVRHTRDMIGSTRQFERNSPH